MEWEISSDLSRYNTKASVPVEIRRAWRYSGREMLIFLT